MRVKKRNKRSRLRGQRTCGYGFRKKHKGGKGNRGGIGMAGTGKRAGHKRTWVDKYMPDYFGKRGFKSLYQIKRLKVINLGRIEENLANFLKSGKAKKTPEGIMLDLEGYKILGDAAEGLKFKEKLIIKASKISEGAREKLEKAGGSIELAKNLLKKALPKEPLKKPDQKDFKKGPAK